MKHALMQDCEANARRILFVGHEAPVRATFAGVVRAQGFIVDVAKSGADALQLAELNSYPVIATELVMPEFDGIALIRQLHLKNPATVFIIVTESSDVQVPTDSDLRNHVSSIVTKPFEVKELVETLNRSIRLWESHAPTPPPTLEPQEEALNTILLLEDDDADADLVEAFLLLTCHRGKVKRARRLSEALYALEEQDFGLIITDLSLPDARGLDAVLRIQNTARQTPLIVLSSQSQDGIAVQALQAGAQDFLVKGGVDARALVRSIQYARERKRSEQDLARLASFDPLTGLANRAHFEQCLNSTLSRARRSQDPFAVLFADLDGFKPINDEYGHGAGDALLVEVSRRLEASLREYDTVARLGGDEFGVVLDKLSDHTEAAFIAHRILEAIGQPYFLGDIEVGVTGSIGIAIYPEDGREASDLVKAADQAMYVAKRRGRNTFRASTPAMRGETSGKNVSTTFQDVFSKEELSLEYSPRFDVAQGSIVAVEGVLAWQKGAARPAAPCEFLRTLRDPQGHDHLSHWTIAKACRDLPRLQQSTPTLRRVSVAVCAQQLFGAGLVRAVLQALEETGLEPSCLELSLTEASVTRKPDQAKVVLDELKEQGIRLSMTEFGAGCSSLFSLYSLPLDTIKLDRRFVEDLSSNPQCQAVVAGIIAMAKGVGVEVVAGWVDTPAQRDLLMSSGCHLILGSTVDGVLPTCGPI